VDYGRAWAEARSLVWAHRRSLGFGLLIMVVNRLSGLVLPGSSKFLIDEVIGNRRVDMLLPLAGLAAAATVVQAVSGFALSQIVSIAAQRAIAEIRRQVQAHVLRLPASYFAGTKTGVLISRIMTDAEGVRNLVGTGLVQLVGGAVTATIGLIVLFYLNWQLTTVTILVLLTFGIMMAIAFRRLRPLFRERGELNAEVTGRLAEALGGVQVVKVYTAEKREELIFTRGVYRLFRNVARTITGISAVGAGATVIIGAVGVLMIVIGGQALLDGTMTLGVFVMYVFFVGLVAAPLVQIASIGTQISEAFAGLDRIRELRQMPTEDVEDSRKPPLREVEGEIVFDDVWFEYDPGVPVLRGVSFTATPGSTTALVGSSGGGKSTLVNLVMSFHQPNSGRVLVDGQDLKTLRVRDYRTNVGAVLQENFLFDGTIRENIAYGRPGASDEDVRAAGRLAHCEEFVNRFELGYDTIVGERGVKLSGGQRQRVAIARAILADPKLLVLDEATSSLDSESEGLIRDGLRTLRSGRTTFVIAHRLSTIESADQILVIESGEIVERGTHDELLRANGRYRQLYESQYGIERDRFINPGEDLTPEAPSPREEIPAITGPPATRL
jgi:ABC-type multidrug transport system fused ATPase/permease subunit